MKLNNVTIYRVEYEVPPDMTNWTAIIAATTHDDAVAYIQRFWGKPCNFISVGMQTKLDAVSNNVVSQIMKLGLPKVKGQAQVLKKKEEKKETVIKKE